MVPSPRYKNIYYDFLSFIHYTNTCIYFDVTEFENKFEDLFILWVILIYVYMVYKPNACVIYLLYLEVFKYIIMF